MMFYWFLGALWVIVAILGYMFIAGAAIVNEDYDTSMEVEKGEGEKEAA